MAIFRSGPNATFDPDHVAQAVVFMASLPLEINVQVMTVRTAKIPYIGRG
jgi:NADP-dependent 3-hydroxy acid dehydrogenase YdfG